MPGKTSISDAAASAAAAASSSNNSNSNSRVIGSNSTLATSTPLGSYADLETVMEAEQVRGRLTKLCVKEVCVYMQAYCVHISKTDSMSTRFAPPRSTSGVLYR